MLPGVGGPREQHRAAAERVERACYTAAARRLRRYAAVRRHGRPDVEELKLVLIAAATVLEAAGLIVPADPFLRDSVAGLAGYVESLPEP